MMVLSAIYECDFCGFSYGFQPGRGPHDALDALSVAIDRRNVSWVVDADIQNFFGAVSQEWLVRFVEHRPEVAQGGAPRRRGRDGGRQGDRPGLGDFTASCECLSALRPGPMGQTLETREATGDMIIVRYADDVVVGFEHEGDARRFLDAMRARLEEFALPLHPEKTRLIEFGRHAATFGFLGFTFICGKTRRGRFQLQRKTRVTACGRSFRRSRGSYGVECTGQFPNKGSDLGRQCSSQGLSCLHPPVEGVPRRWVRRVASRTVVLSLRPAI